MPPLWNRENVYIALYSCIQYQYELKTDTLEIFHFMGMNTTKVQENRSHSAQQQYNHQTD